MQGIATLKLRQALSTIAKKHQMILYENIKYRIVHSISNVGLGIQYKADVRPKKKFPHNEREGI